MLSDTSGKSPENVEKIEKIHQNLEKTAYGGSMESIGGCRWEK
jgi:hypothetical protein